MAQLVKNQPVVWETRVQSLGCEDSLEKGKATHSSILAWRIPWTVYTPWGRKESDTTDRLSLPYSALWNSEKVVEARGLPTRNGGQKGPCTLESHRALLGISISVAGWDWAPSQIVGH